MRVALAEIKGMARRVRKSQSPEKLEELADSLKEFGGVIVPIKVRKNGPAYPLVNGHRRVAPDKMAGLKEIEAIVEDVSEDKLLTQALVENVVREDMAAIDIAKALQTIIDETGCTQVALGKKLGWTDGNIRAYLEMLNPELNLRADSNRLLGPKDVVQAKAGTGGDLKLAGRVLEKAAKDDLSTRETRRVAEVVRTANELGGEKLVKRVLAQPYEDIRQTTEALEASELIRPQSRKVTSAPATRGIALNQVDRLMGALIQTVSAAVAYKPNKALIRQARPRWIAMLRRLIKTLEEA